MWRLALASASCTGGIQRHHLIAAWSHGRAQRHPASQAGQGGYFRLSPSLQGLVRPRRRGSLARRACMMPCVRLDGETRCAVAWDQWDGASELRAIREARTLPYQLPCCAINESDESVRLARLWFPLRPCHPLRDVPPSGRLELPRTQPAHCPDCQACSVTPSPL